MAEFGQYDFFGACDPTRLNRPLWGCANFTVGLFRWEEKYARPGARPGLKHGKVFSRVKGPNDEAPGVKVVAQKICDMLNNGTVLPAELKKTILWDSECYITKAARK